MRWGIFVVGLIACGPSVRESKAPSGESVFTVTCDGAGAQCRSAARSKCSDGYATDEESQTTSGPYTLVFRCERRTVAAPEPSGRSTSEVIGDVIQGAADGWVRGSNASQSSCYDSATCLSGERCVVPKGQSRGFCAEIR